ncbi:MAG: polyamine aminopropyltransferase [Armatimonadetes bacterium]|nr:polyamine aminopropyltransferase [Armatimonadota bacterium]
MAADHQAASGIWFSETHTHAIQYKYRILDVHTMTKSKYQDVWIVTLEGYGKALILDSKIQSAQLDEFMFHEPMVHPAMFTHPDPKRVLVAGGGEGATLREVLRHKSVESATMVDIDDELVKLCDQHMPEWHQGAFVDPRTTMIYDDAMKVIANNKNAYDVVISDLTDPLEAGPSQFLFTKEFYQSIYESLTDDGVLAVQAGAADPLYPYLFGCIVKTLGEVFPVVHGYWSFVAGFLLPWGFVVASKKHDPLKLTPEEIMARIESRRVTGLQYYSPFVHFGMFGLPPYLTKVIQEARVLTNDQPYSWEA